MNNPTATAEALKRISAARTLLILDHCFFGHLALKLIPVESARTNTMATDGRHLFFSADYTLSLPQPKLIGLLAHECMHPAMLHQTRRGSRDPKLWNMACDHAINPLILEQGLQLPDGGLLDAAFKGLSAEQIYSKLQQQQQQEQEQQQDSAEQQAAGGSDGEGESEGEGQGEGEGESEGDAQGSATSSESGSGGSPSDELADMPGAVYDAPAEEAAQEAADWQVAVTQAAQTARMMGKLPASLQQAVQQATKPDTDWRAITARFAQSCSASDYSWRRPSPRYAAMGLYLPQLKVEAMPPIVVVLDSSGSVGSEEFAAFTEHVALIADECLPERLYVIECDAAIHRIAEFERGERVRITQRTSSGGTDFRPPFAHLEREGIEPACLIYLTDGEGPFPDAPAYPVLWAMTTDAQAPFGETVRVTA